MKQHGKDSEAAQQKDPEDHRTKITTLDCLYPDYFFTQEKNECRVFKSHCYLGWGWGGSATHSQTKSIVIIITIIVLSIISGREVRNSFSLGY